MKTIFAKYNSERLPKFQIVTKIVENKDGKRYALKEALCDEANEHIERIYNNFELLKSTYDINLVKPTKIENGVMFEMAEGVSLEHILLDAMAQNNSEKFKKYIDKFLEFVDGMVSKRDVIFEPSKEFENVFGAWAINEPQDIIKVANIDLLFGNIFVDENDNFTLIDYEWVFDFEVPKSYVVWRSFAMFSAYHSISIEKFADLYFKNNDYFLSLEDKFQSFVLGEDRKYFLAPKVGKAAHFLDLEKKETIINSDYFIQLFIEDTNGISEENSLKLPVSQNKELQHFEFDLSDRQNIKTLRLDPLNDYCIIKINKILIDEMEITSFSSNACHIEENIYYFNTKDPQLYLDIMHLESVERMTVDIEYLHTGERALNCIMQKIQTLSAELTTKEQKIQTLSAELTTKEQKIQTLSAELIGVYMSKSWKITRPLRSMMRIIRRCFVKSNGLILMF